MAKKSKEKVRAIVLGDTALGLVATVEMVELVPGFRVCVNGLEIDGSPSFDHWEELGRTLRVTEKGIQFAIGDFVNAAETQLGEMASQLIDATDWAEPTVAVYRWLSKRIAPARRRMDRLGIRHHLLVAALTPKQQEKWLGAAANDEGETPWSVARLKAAIDAGEDLAIIGLYVVAQCTTEAQRVLLMNQLESQGIKCRAVERRQKQKTIDAAVEATTAAIA